MYKYLTQYFSTQDPIFVKNLMSNQIRIEQKIQINKTTNYHYHPNLLINKCLSIFFQSSHR